LQNEIANLHGQPDFTSKEASTTFLARMNGTLDAALPGWRELNRDPDVVAWEVAHGARQTFDVARRHGLHVQTEIYGMRSADLWVIEVIKLAAPRP
jgi:hypothetical protein